MKKFLVFLALLFLPFAVGCNAAEDIPESEVQKILFIGNSFTFYSDVPSIFSKIAASSGKSAEVEAVTQGSHTLTKFADKNDEYGKIVEQKLKANDGYTAVILQEQSTRPLTDYADFLSGAQSLQTKINNTQRNCKIYLYSTWGYQSAAEARGTTVTKMEEDIRKANEKAAQIMGVEVSYVGKAFSTVYEDYPAINLYYGDNKHQSYAGAFLSACVHAATVLGIDPRNCAYNGELDENTATILKNVANKTVN